MYLLFFEQWKTSRGHLLDYLRRPSAYTLYNEQI